ncbi:MAG: hypothetical protein SO122_06790 [Eubacteriales bacterium]|nr:hypothetical protein [Eubacteriales bacterium]
MRDYSMELARIAAGIVADVMGDVKFSTTYSSDSNSIIMEFDGYPIYGAGKKAKVFVQFPRSTFSVRAGKVVFTPLRQADCRFYQNTLGEPFSHPHVYNDGHPCWDGGGRERAADFISNIIETLALANVTQYSVDIGRCASGVMGVSHEAVKNANAQRKRVIEALKCKPMLTDRRKLESYVGKRWSSMISILMRTA